jgi:excisionase family DNA binding protein
MSKPNEDVGRPISYTVREAARIMRCNPSTLYRAIREDVFPAVRVHTRYVVPAASVDKLATEAAELGGRVDVAAREVAQLTGCVVVNRDNDRCARPTHSAGFGGCATVRRGPSPRGGSGGGKGDDRSQRCQASLVS